MDAVMHAARRTLKLRAWQFSLLAVIFIVWWALTKPGLIPPFVFDNDTQAAFFLVSPWLFSRASGTGLSPTPIFIPICR